MGFSHGNHPSTTLFLAKETDGFVAIAQEASDQGRACTWAGQRTSSNEKCNGKTHGNFHSEIIELLGLAAMTIIIYHTIHFHSCWITTGFTTLVWEKTSNPDIARKVHHEWSYLRCSQVACSNQTWLARKSPINGGLSGRIIYKWRCSIDMFDYRMVI